MKSDREGDGRFGCGCLALITWPTPMTNWKGLPRSLEESNLLPFVSVPARRLGRDGTSRGEDESSRAGQDRRADAAGAGGQLGARWRGQLGEKRSPPRSRRGREKVVRFGTRAPV